jgi:hypothetical protein
MPICRSSGAFEMWENEFYKHPAPLALRTDNVDSDDLLFANSSNNSVRILALSSVSPEEKTRRGHLLRRVNNFRHVTGYFTK